jgi:hypothetical protein
MTVSDLITTLRGGAVTRVYAPDGFCVGRVVRIVTKEDGSRPVSRWAAKCSPLAFDPTGVQRVARELWAPVEGSDYLPGRHRTQREAQRELETYLRDRSAPGLG